MAAEFDPKIAARLPPIDAALVLMTTSWESKRERFGFRWCEATSIGEFRKMLGPPPPKLSLTKRSTLEREVERARDGARVLLGEMCRVCPHTECGMKNW